MERTSLEKRSAYDLKGITGWVNKTLKHFRNFLEFQKLPSNILNIFFIFQLGWRIADIVTKPQTSKPSASTSKCIELWVTNEPQQPTYHVGHPLGSEAITWSKNSQSLFLPFFFFSFLKSAILFSWNCLQTASSTKIYSSSPRDCNLSTC